MAQNVQNVYVDQGSVPQPSPARTPTLPPFPKIFWGFFVFQVRVFSHFAPPGEHICNSGATFLAPHHGHIKGLSNGVSHCGVVSTGLGS